MKNENKHDDELELNKHEWMKNENKHEYFLDAEMTEASTEIKENGNHVKKRKKLFLYLLFLFIFIYFIYFLG